MLVAFRTDASADSGLGHLRRCLSLAQGLSRLGCESVFLCRQGDIDGDIASLVRAAGCDVHWLTGSQVGNQIADAEASVTALDKREPDWIVVDDYTLDARWHRHMADRLNCRVAAIDDLANRPFDVDLLVNHNLTALEPRHHHAQFVVVRSDTRRLSGPRFAMLGPAFESPTSHTLRATVEKIGIFLGATDPTQHSAVALQACRTAGFKGDVDVVTTHANRNLSSLQQAVDADGRARLLVDLPNLHDFNLECDLVIGAGGGGAWERCAVGVPSLTLCLVDNQSAVVPALVDKGATLSAEHNSPAGIAAALQPLLSEAELRADLSRRAHGLVDGHGVLRISVAMASAFGLKLQPATLKHARSMWSWRNHPSVRQVSREPAEISFTDHLSWLNRTLEMSERTLWIGYAGPRPIGVIRFDKLAGGQRYEVSLYLDPLLQGLGLGSQLLKAGEALLLTQKAATAVEAEVLAGNAPSRFMFLSAGYKHVGGTRYTKSFSA